MWQPIKFESLNNLVLRTELELNEEILNFWNLIKIEPEKWSEKSYGNEGGGFWVVAICGRKVIWYNDIEEGFNISEYKTYNEIETYQCSQVELIWSITSLFELLKI